MERRVVMTGMGAVTPLGIGVEPTWEGMRAGRSGITNITLFDATDFTSQIAGEVSDFDPTLWMDAREVRHTDRFVHFAMAAAVSRVTPPESSTSGRCPGWARMTPIACAIRS